METTIVYWGVILNHGKQHGNNYSILGVILTHGKRNGNKYSILGVILNRGKQNANNYSILAGNIEPWKTTWKQL